VRSKSPFSSNFRSRSPKTKLKNTNSKQRIISQLYPSGVFTNKTINKTKKKLTKGEKELKLEMSKENIPKKVDITEKIKTSDLNNKYNNKEKIPLKVNDKVE